MSTWPDATVPRGRSEKGSDPLCRNGPAGAAHKGGRTPFRIGRGTWAVRITLTVWTAVVIFILVRSYLQPRRNSVYPIFGNAGREWIDGVDLYDRTIDRADLDTFRYLPVIAAWFAPFGLLPDNLGGVLWRVVNGSVFLAGFVVFVRTVVPGQRRLDARAISLLGWALLPLSLGSLNNSQPNSLVVGCLLLAAAATVRQRWTAAAVCLALPVLIKVYPLAVVLLFLLLHPWRLSWRTALVLLAGCLLPFAFQDPEYVGQVYQSWFHQVSADNRTEFPLVYSYRDFHLLTRVAGFPMERGAYRVLQLAMALLVAAVVLHGHWRGWSRQQHVRAAVDLGCCWMILFGPATENCTYALLAPTLALASWEALLPGQLVWKRFGTLAIVGGFVGAAAVTATPLGRHVSFVLMPAGALLLFCERLASLCQPLRRLATPAAQAQPLQRAA